MRLDELAVSYRAEAAILRQRVRELEAALQEAPEEAERERLARRIRPLREMLRDVRDVAVVLEHYYDRGYRRNGRYSI